VSMIGAVAVGSEQSAVSSYDRRTNPQIATCDRCTGPMARTATNCKGLRTSHKVLFPGNNWYGLPNHHANRPRVIFRSTGFVDQDTT